MKITITRIVAESDDPYNDLVAVTAERDGNFSIGLSGEKFSPAILDGEKHRHEVVMTLTPGQARRVAVALLHYGVFGGFEHWLR